MPMERCLFIYSLCHHNIIGATEIMGRKKTGREIIETSSVQKIRFDFHVIYVPSELMHSSFRQPHSKIEALRLSHVYNNAIEQPFPNKLLVSKCHFNLIL